MSMYVGFGDGPPTEIGSNRGWGQFCSFGERLSDSPNIGHIVAYGWCKDLPALADELKEAIPQADQETAAVGQSLLDAISGETGAAVITDGMGPSK